MENSLLWVSQAMAYYINLSVCHPQRELDARDFINILLSQIMVQEQILPSNGTAAYLGPTQLCSYPLGR